MDIKKVLRSYTTLLKEIKARHRAVQLFSQGPPLVDAVIARESAYLQLRMICELIAMLCLLAHGDIPAVSQRRMRRAYEADWIMKRLASVHADFYPKPGKQVLDHKGKVVRLESIERDYLTRDQLIELYGEAGGIVHRGSIENVLGQKAFRALKRTAIDRTVQIKDLLSHHQISLIDGNQIWALMKGVNIGGEPQAVYMTKLGPVSNARKS